MKPLLVLIAFVATLNAHAAQSTASPCELGGYVAYQAYLAGTYDAQYPDSKMLHYQVDYWSDMATFAHDRRIAHGAVDYIAARIKPTGMRKPWDGAVYEAAREYIVEHCQP